MEVHPANATRRFTDEEREKMRKDLLERGQQETIKVFEGMIIDGKNRYDILQEEGIRQQMEDIQIEGDPRVWVFRQREASSLRGSMKTNERLLLAAAAPRKKVGDASSQEEPSREEVCKEFGVKPSTLDRVVRAVKFGDSAVTLIEQECSLKALDEIISKFQADRRTLNKWLAKDKDTFASDYKDLKATEKAAKAEKKRKADEKARQELAEQARLEAKKKGEEEVEENDDDSESPFTAEDATLTVAGESSGINDLKVATDGKAVVKSPPKGSTSESPGNPTKGGDTKESSTLGNTQEETPRPKSHTSVPKEQEQDAAVGDLNEAERIVYLIRVRNPSDSVVANVIADLLISFPGAREELAKNGSGKSQCPICEPLEFDFSDLDETGFDPRKYPIPGKWGSSKEVKEAWVEWCGHMEDAGKPLSEKDCKEHCEIIKRKSTAERVASCLWGAMDRAKFVPLKTPPPMASASSFVPPTKKQIEDYKEEKGLAHLDVPEFYGYYEGNGWMIGKNKMTNWKATARRWNDKNEKESRHKPRPNSRQIEFLSGKRRIPKGQL